MRRRIWISIALLTGGSFIAGAAQAPPGGANRAQSTASQRPPQTVTPQTYTQEQIQAGQTRFSSQCGFCHGRDAAGGETGPDLTRSILVAQDVRGDKIAPVARSGRPDKGMPPFDLSDADMAVIVAYIHDQKSKAELQGGGRRSVDVADLQTGNADAGRQYFIGAGGCAKCHSATGDLAGIGTRVQGLALLQRMLNPPAPKVTVTLRTGESFTGTVTVDEFTVGLRESATVNHSWPKEEVKLPVDDPLAAHFELLGKLTDTDMHNVHAFLQSLR